MIRRNGWLIAHDDAGRDFMAIYVPHQPQPGLLDIWRAWLAPVATIINRHVRAAQAARLAYRESVK